MVVTLLAAQSLDGWITRHGIDGDSFASADDKIHFRQILRESDCCIMGRATYEASKDRLRLEARPELRRVVLTHSPERYATDGRGRSLEFTKETPVALVRRLRAEGAQKCALLGGAQVYGAFLAKGLVDEVSVTIEPAIFGFGTPLASAAGGGGGLPLDVRLELVKAKPLGGGAVEMRYRVCRN